MSDDLIRRQDAIDALGERPLVWDEHTDEYELGQRNQYDFDLVAIKAVPSAQPEQRWIPVNERLPEVNTRCLCTYEYKEGTCIDFGIYMKRGWFVSGVTAWMPLPEPYKEESDAEIH